MRSNFAAVRQLDGIAMKTLGIYVQIPFCASKCTFCNFSSKVAHRTDLEAYLANLEAEIGLLARSGRMPSSDDGWHPSLEVLDLPVDSLDDGWHPSLEVLDLPVDSLYLGGGTPTLAGREGLGMIFSALRREFRFTEAPEATLEMTPGSADASLLAACRDLGVNRLSIGAQSFDDHELASVGRLHSGVEVEEQVHRARAAGFENISLDLIAGLPHQTRTSWMASLTQAIELEPDHVSVYLFEVDEKSRLGNELLSHGDRYHAGAVPDDEFMAAAYKQSQELLESAGLVQYEISNFARPGFESRHNRRYWRLEPYLGLGAGAHSFDGHVRWSNAISRDDYAARVASGDLPIAEWHALTEVERIEEFFFLGLRQCGGVDLDAATRRWGCAALEPWQSPIDSLLREGLLEQTRGNLRLAPEAYLLSNDVFQQFLIDKENADPPLASAACP
jgi:oxygen-independent coproporphyrinogen-3 oxidase